MRKWWDCKWEGMRNKLDKNVTCHICHLVTSSFFLVYYIKHFFYKLWIELHPFHILYHFIFLYWNALSWKFSTCFFIGPSLLINVIYPLTFRNNQVILSAFSMLCMYLKAWHLAAYASILVKDQTRQDKSKYSWV